MPLNYEVNFCPVRNHSKQFVDKPNGAAGHEFEGKGCKREYIKRVKNGEDIKLFHPEKYKANNAEFTLVIKEKVELGRGANKY